MDIRAYLQRRSDELMSDIGRRTTALGARSWMEGAVRALEALDALDRQTGQRVMEDFDRRLEDEGAVERVVLSHSVKAGLSAGGGPPKQDVAREDVAELEGVVAVGEEMSLPGGVRVAVLHLTRWSTGAEVAWAILGPDSILREYRARPRLGVGQASPLPWDLGAWDDVGTRYRVEGGSGGGGGGQALRALVRLGPRIPREATELTLELHDVEGRKVLQTRVALGGS